jgi:hypothetical protein
MRTTHAPTTASVWHLGSKRYRKAGFALTPTVKPFTMHRVYHCWNYKEESELLRYQNARGIGLPSRRLKATTEQLHSTDFFERAVRMLCWITRERAIEERPELKRTACGRESCVCTPHLRVVSDAMLRSMKPRLPKRPGRQSTCLLRIAMDDYVKEKETTQLLNKWVASYNADYEDNLDGFNPISDFLRDTHRE